MHFYSACSVPYQEYLIAFINNCDNLIVKTEQINRAWMLLIIHPDGHTEAHIQKCANILTLLPRSHYLHSLPWESLEVKESYRLPSNIRKPYQMVSIVRNGHFKIVQSSFYHSEEHTESYLWAIDSRLLALCMRNWCQTPSWRSFHRS
jgi:hypothetical protein